MSEIAPLIVERVIRASPARVFAAWTTPELMTRWWGPEGVAATGVEIDLRVGGRYRIGNRLPDDKVIWIAGIFEQITAPGPTDEPARLVYTWGVEPAESDEQVAVVFLPDPAGTRVHLTHTRIASQRQRDNHMHGWAGCLDGLEGLEF